MNTLQELFLQEAQELFGAERRLPRFAIEYGRCGGSATANPWFPKSISPRYSSGKGESIETEQTFFHHS